MSVKGKVMMQDWQQKCAYLQARYEPEAPLSFYNAVGIMNLPKDFKICAMRANAPIGQRFRRYTSVDDLLQDSALHQDAYVYPAVYYNSYAKETLLHCLSCIYIDLDHVSASDLVRLCREDFYGHRPTYLVNSGNGVHLVYVFPEPISTYDWVKFLLRRVHRGLLEVFKAHGFDADLGTGISHAYRVVGSRTKLGKVCTAYRVGTSIEVQKLSQSVGIDWKRQRDTQEKNACKTVATVSHMGKGFYAYMMREIVRRTQDGHRYNSIFALVCVGYKCGIPVEKIREDAQILAKRLDLPLKEAVHAVDACDPKKARSVRSSTLERWLGWEFEHATKRNGRTRAEHLAMVADKRTSESRKRVMDCLQENPGASISAMARLLQMTRKTVAKYIHEARDAAVNVLETAQGTVEMACTHIETMCTEKTESIIAYIPALMGVLCSVGVFMVSVQCSRGSPIQLVLSFG